MPSGERLLLVQQNWLGDVLFATPAIRALRRQYPKAHIAALLPARVEAVLKNNPHLDEIIIYNERAPVFSPVFWETVFFLRRKFFDTAVFFHSSRTKVRLARWAGISNRWGYGSDQKLLTRAVDLPVKELHRIDHFLNLLQSLEISPDGRAMEFFPDRTGETGLEKLLRERGVALSEPYVVVHAGGNWGLKRWPTDYFSQWIYYFLEQYGWKVVLCGSADEETIAQKIASKFSSTKVVSLCGKTSLDELAVLLKNAKLLLSNDSGPIHLAASQKTRIIGLYGPTSPTLTGPVSEAPMKILWKDVGCRVPCYFRSCDYRVCMDLLLPQEVFLETQKVLSADAKN